ncbi:MAG: hypothetical protein LBB88_06850 [Planctomycetaceae bacterium]|nr:hypothetical protein [Planctomycetaceae bacterium]
MEKIRRQTGVLVDVVLYIEREQMGHRCLKSEINDSKEIAFESFQTRFSTQTFN